MFIVVSTIVLTFVIGAMIVSRRAQEFKERLRAAEAARVKLQIKANELEDEVRTVRNRERDLQDQINRLISERDNLVSLTVRTGTSKPRNVVEVLLNSGTITPEGLQKATDYKKKTRSPYSIEEILVLLDQVGVEDVRAAKRQLGEG